MYDNFDLKNVITPVRPEAFEQLLTQYNYDEEKTRFLIEGFKYGFSIGYEGNTNVQMKAPNLKLRIGTETDLWNKVMKEVKLKRYAGPFDKVPFDTYIQSPIGLVPKDGGKNTRLIFHLSYPRNSLKQSVNANTPDQLKRVKYSDFDQAVLLCIEEGGEFCFLSKSDMSAAFRQVEIRPEHWRYLIMMARCPLDGKTYYFIDKCLPFGAAISCAIFQKVSDAISFIVYKRTNKKNVNDLDDFLFLALLKWLCDHQMRCFLDICEVIGFPVAMEKTVWSTTRLVFLGLLIDTMERMIFVPLEKLQKGRDLVDKLLQRQSKKTTIRELQELCRFLNFLGRAVVPGRAFTRRLYHFTKNDKYKPHHHVRINQEMKLDLQMWKLFLYHHSALARPFLDFTRNGTISASKIDFDSDASGNFRLGMGATCAPNWILQQWNEEFCKKVKPSIEYLELYAVVTGVLLWIERYRNKRVIIFCDNMSVVNMINNTSSSCRNCMVLIRILVLKGLTENVRVFAHHLSSKQNCFSDALSRLKLDTFWKLAKIHNKQFNQIPDSMPSDIWPMEKIWLYN